MLHCAWSHATGVVLGRTIVLSYPRVIVIEADEVLLLTAA
jgi:hypothetical protein